MITWKNFYETKGSGVIKTYDFNHFVKLPWNWQALQKEKIVNALYYYAKENYVNGKPEPLQDFEFSLITLPNLKSINNNEFSNFNLISGKSPNQKDFFRFLKNPLIWYDAKVDQIYDGIKMVGKTPEHFNGKDIRYIAKKG